LADVASSIRRRATIEKADGDIRKGSMKSEVTSLHLDW